MYLNESVNCLSKWSTPVILALGVEVELWFNFTLHVLAWCDLVSSC